MSTTVPTSDERLREAAAASLRRKRKFAEDAGAYVVVNGVLWLIWALTDRSVDGSMPWPAWVSIVWGFFLVLDAWKAYGRQTRPITDDDVDAEMRRLRQE